MTDLSSLTVFITGATSGFGTAIARRFATDGARLILSGRRGKRLEALKAELSAVPVHTVVLDVRDRDAVAQAFAALPAAFAAIDVLVNNAGLALGLEPAQRAELDDWDTMVDTNIKGVMYCTRAALPGMVERKRGHVITIGSVAGYYPYQGGNAYGATKAFVDQFAMNLRADVAGTGVRVTNVAPGLSESEFSLVRFKGDADRAAAFYERTQPLTPEDVAECVHWTAALPAHVNINRIEVMPTVQAFSPLSVWREPKEA
ncbi:MAG TPA: SDR family NAD(P)-dependent oxidoreductase [Patescibacteria group bacterium]|nr:SDR family NAD(P)-dependent oxidoreductase [Patescibacteria group bacterium]